MNYAIVALWIGYAAMLLYVTYLHNHMEAQDRCIVKLLQAAKLQSDYNELVDDEFDRLNKR